MKEICPECSGKPINHGVAKTTAAMEAFVRFTGKPFMGSFSSFSIFFDKLFPIAFRFCSLIGIGNITHVPDSKDSVRTHCLWESARKRNIMMHQFRLFNQPLNMFIAEHNGERIVFEALPRPKYHSLNSGDMDDKGLIKKIFDEHDIPVALGKAVFSLAEAKRLFGQLRKPVITKPSLGSHGRHTRIHINSQGELERGFSSAKRLSPWVIVEEELKGSVYRVALVGGRVIGVLRRDSPTVVGDGKHTIKELIHETNAHPWRVGNFHKIEITDFVRRELAYQNLSLDSRPARGRKIMLHPKVGRTQGGTNANVTKHVHPENIKMFERIASALEDSLVGVDFIIEDIAQSWKEQDRSGVIECNSAPFLDLHHFPYAGEPIDAMGELWKIVFPNSKLSV